MRRTLIITAAVVLLLGAGIGIYFLFLRNSATLTVGEPGTFPSSEGGTEPAEGAPATQELGAPVPNAGTELAPRFVRVSDRPVATGIVAVYQPAYIPPASASGTPATDADVKVEYLERESGNIYAYLAHGRTLTRLTNKTLPGIQDATWLSDGSLAFARFLEKTGQTERVDTYALPVSGEGGYFLQQGLDQVLVRATSTLVTVLSTTDGSSASVSAPSGSNLRTLFTTPLSAIRAGFLGNNYLVSTKGSAKADGYAFVVDAKSGAFTRLLGPLQGFSALPSPNGAYVLYSYLDRGKLALAVLSVSTHVATRLPLTTLPDKCVWASGGASLYCGVPTNLSGTQPDDWYQGASSFTDRLWRVDMGSRVATLVFDPKQAAGIAVDATALTLDRTDDVLGFVNRADHLLYVYDL